MRTTVTLDDALFARAMELAGPDSSASALLHAALCIYVRKLASQRLVALGGTGSVMGDIPRRTAAEPAAPRTPHRYRGEGAG